MQYGAPLLSSRFSPMADAGLSQQARRAWLAKAVLRVVEKRAAQARIENCKDVMCRPSNERIRAMEDLERAITGD